MISEEFINTICDKYNLSCQMFIETRSMLVLNKKNQEYWRLTLKGDRSVIMHHGNTRGDIGGFHLQGKYPSLDAALEYIYYHDSRKVSKRLRNLDKIIELLAQVNKSSAAA